MQTIAQVQTGNQINTWFRQDSIVKISLLTCMVDIMDTINVS